METFRSEKNVGNYGRPLNNSTDNLFPSSEEALQDKLIVLEELVESKFAPVTIAACSNSFRSGYCIMKDHTSNRNKNGRM